MKKLVLIGALSTAALLAGSAAFAGSVETVDNNAAGFYVNANIGAGGNLGLPGGWQTKSHLAWSANGGYQFNRYVAVEAGYLQLPSSKASLSFPSLNITNNFKQTQSLADVLAKGIYPINGQFDVFGKAGLGYSFQTLSDSGTNSSSVKAKHFIVPVFGLGADYNINSNVAVSVQGIANLKHGNSSNIANANFLPASLSGLVGLTYKF